LSAKSQFSLGVAGGGIARGDSARGLGRADHRYGLYVLRAGGVAHVPEKWAGLSAQTSGASCRRVVDCQLWFWLFKIALEKIKPVTEQIVMATQT
jgi:hypothetical protein